MKSLKITSIILATTILDQTARAETISCGASELPYCVAMITTNPDGLMTQCNPDANFTVHRSGDELIFEKRDSEQMNSTYIAKINVDIGHYESVGRFLEKTRDCLSENECRKSLDRSETSRKFANEIGQTPIISEYYKLFQQFGGTPNDSGDSSSSPLLKEDFTQEEASLHAYAVTIGEGGFIFIENSAQSLSIPKLSQFAFFEVNTELSECLK